MIFTKNDVEKFIGKDGFILISDNFKRTSDKIEFCDKDGYKYCQVFRDFKIGRRQEPFAKYNKFSLENISRYISLNNIECELVSTKNSGNKKPLSFKCKCGKNFTALINNFVKGQHICPDCMSEKMSKKFRLDYDEVVQVYKKRGYKILSPKEDYKNRESDFIIKDKDGYVYNSKFRDFKKNEVFKFSPKNKFTIENMKRYIKIHGFKSKLLSTEYVNSDSELKFKCHQCGNVFLRTFNNFKKGTGVCSDCSTGIGGKMNAFTYDEVCQELKDKRYNLLSTEYLGCDAHLDVSDNDGYLYHSTFTVLKKHHPEFVSIYNPYTIYNIKRFITINELDCKLISTQYINTNEKLKFRCGCGEEFETSWNVLRQTNKSRCNKCTKSMSGYEVKTEKFLKDIGIEFLSQYAVFTNSNQSNKRFMKKFDFKIDVNGVMGFIEVDGEFHFKGVTNFKNRDVYSDTKRRDEEKNKYCKDNNIPLLRIPYWDFDNDKYKDKIIYFIKQISD